MQKIKIILILLTANICQSLAGYGLPALGLGSSSFLDGGPLRQIPGWYFQFYNQYYSTHRFLDSKGELLGAIPSPRYKEWATAYQFIYLSQKDIMGLGNFGFDITLPVAFYSRIQPNDLGITSSGAGFGDLVLGVFAQALPVFRADRPVYVHRFEFAVSIPTGKNKLPFKTINPGNAVVFIDPYWSGTFYFTPEFSASWRLYYLWVSENHKIHLKAGDAIHGTFALEYEIRTRLFLGVNGYFLAQIKDNQLNGLNIPESRERVIGIGVGGLYSFARRFASVLIANLYWETDVRNRTQGFRFFLRYLRHF